MSNIFAVSSLVSFPHFIFINNVSCTFPLPQVSFLLTLSSSYFLSCIIFWFVLARFSTFHYLFHFFFTFSDVLNFIFCVIFFLCSFTFYFVHLLFDFPHSYLFPSSFLLCFFFFLLLLTYLFSSFYFNCFLCYTPLLHFSLFSVSPTFSYMFPSLLSFFTFPFFFSSLILFPFLLPCFQSVEGKYERWWWPCCLNPIHHTAT